MKKYVIKDILDRETKEKRTDEKYSKRINCVMKLINGNVGMPMLLEYLFDSEGNKITMKFLYTSPIKNIALNQGLIEVTTENSIYKLEVIHDKDN